MDRAIKTVIKMINRRGYTITHKNDGNIIAVNDKKKKIVFFTDIVNKFNSDKAKEYINIVHGMGIPQCIIIYKEVTSMANKIVINSLDIILELFHIDKVQIDITEHRLQPKYIKLSDDEAKEFKKKYGIRHPVQLTTDPISLYYFYQRGDIIKIIRKNGYITYRIVKG